MTEDEKVPVGDGIQCVNCDKVFEEIKNSFRISVEQMKSIAAAGKGQEYEAENNKLYNRYFGCAIAMDTLLNEFFKDRLPPRVEPVVDSSATVLSSEEVPADVLKN